MKTGRAWIACLGATLLLWVAGESPHAAEEPADLVVLGARIHTAGNKPLAQAMAIRGRRIIAVGTADEVRRRVGPATEIWNLDGRAVLPGLVDSHGHVAGLGEQLAIVDLVGTKTYDEVIARVRQRAQATPKGQWVLGRGWDQNDWPVQAMPHHDALSAATPDHPVALERVDGHALLVNRAALEGAGIGRETANPSGGLIERDRGGPPTGVLVDEAMDLVTDRIPSPDRAELERRLLEAMRTCAAAGLTMVHDAGIGRETWAAYRALLERDQLPIRIYAMASRTDPLLEDLIARGGETSDRLALRAIKVSYDGALGSRGALLSRPYSDRAGHVGLERWTSDSLARLCERAIARNLQVRVHAIGDLAATRVLDAFERAFDRKPRPKLRWAMEHAQVVRPQDVRRFQRLGIVASMQATHATSDGPWAGERLGPERVRWSYAWRQFLRAGVRFANGSDFPVESHRPLLGLYASITRRDLDGKLPRAGWRPEERLTPAEALKSFSLWGAWLAFRETDLGSLEPGKFADFVVLDRDPFSGPPETLLQTRVLRTVVGGKTVFEASSP
jgi:predicted amidohydrolase YtcJ